MHFLIILWAFCCTLLGRPAVLCCSMLALSPAPMQQASSSSSNCRLSFCIAWLASYPSYSPLLYPLGCLVLIPFRSCAIFPATWLAALQSKSNITSHAKGLHLPYPTFPPHSALLSFPPPSVWFLSYDQAQLPYCSRPGERKSEKGRVRPTTDRTSLWTPGTKMHWENL